jgi:hypothetical protein
MKKKKEKRETDAYPGILHCDLYDKSQTLIAFLRYFNLVNTK